MSEMNWDSTIQNDSTFELLPEGDYDFVIKSFERGRHDGSAKLPPCHKAVLTIEVDNGEKSGTLTHNLFLHTSVEGILCQFFIGIGQRKHGQPLKMDWSKVIGARGRCKVSIRKWTGNDGQERESNQINKFYEPEEQVEPAEWKPGTF
ncbi:MAG: DUF669 domain-containing protein [Christensenellales bacterium]|jgi:hypothetical protein